MHQNGKQAGVGGERARSVACRAHVVFAGTYQGGGRSGFGGGGGVEGLLGFVAFWLRGVVDEPAAVESGGIGFGRAQEVPVAIPDFDPGAVS